MLPLLRCFSVFTYMRDIRVTASYAGVATIFAALIFSLLLSAPLTPALLIDAAYAAMMLPLPAIIT